MNVTAVGGRAAQAVDLSSLDFKFAHLGLAVPASPPAFRFLAALGYTVGRSVFDPVQSVNLAMCHHPVMPAVEVVWPGDGPSPVDRLVKRGSSVYHLCYEVDDLEAAVASMEMAGFSVLPIAAPQPAVLFGGRRVWFLMVEEFGLIELLEGSSL